MSTPELDAVVVTSLVEDAVTAPSMHNAQPWRFVHRAGSGSLALYGDPDRTLPIADPDHRALHLGCGAALFNLRVSAAHHGWTAEVRLLPDPDHPWHLADVRLRRTGSVDHGLADLHPAVRRRHTSRFPFTDEPIPEPVLGGLHGAALLEGCRLITPGAWHADAVMELVRDAEFLEAANEAVRAEIATWTRTGRTGEGPTTEGVPAEAIGPRQYGVSAPVRDFDSPRRVADRGVADFEKHPRLALLGTVEDTPADWLRAGQAMQRVLLQATLDGLATSLMSQPLEWPELRSSVRDPSSAIGFVHMVFRLGYGPSGGATPRRPVGEVLSFR
ncbi:nitroreductase [Streptomyces sp. Je 1-79]|uniref:Acg family FMN-binding oxidoreductase n=1 Tax=Streptomyces sp. Je 1-79 TaxID=2943847 RepID=UPI0021A2D50A|nr:nitroreductase [Streptomyces sp. Je 1-79]MCT4353538.1 nitroreductase [Streptomyces sp. Je 1-79]